MTRQIRWLHLSDFHVGKDSYATRKMFDYIHRLVRQRVEGGWMPDLIFLTGDIAQQGKESEYETFWLEFVDPLHSLIGNNISTRTYVVPGNHDADRHENPAFDRAEIAGPTSKYLDPTDEGNKLRSMLIPRFRQFLINDLTNAAAAFGSAKGAFSEVVIINEIPIGIVGVNTAWLSKDEYDERKLTPGKSLLEGALERVGAKGVHLKFVLGHHPIGWFVPNLQRPIKSLLGQHNAIYLHGHLHDAWAEPDYGGGHPYLAIQSGACFQAREGERWRNGLVLGELSLDTETVNLQPMTWVSGQQSWVLQTEAFHESRRVGDWWKYEIPSAIRNKVDYTRKPPSVTNAPKGWSVLSTRDLIEYCKPLPLPDAVRFFDGAVPDWPTALSTSIPRRRFVKALTSHIAAGNDGEAPRVMLLLAAGCEGKTTALLQAAFEVCKSEDGWRILQRRDESQPLDIPELHKVVTGEFKWLVVVDEADRAAADVLVFLRTLPEGMRGRVHCLMASRDSDWRSARADTLNWASTAFRIEHMKGLDLEDATAVIAAWEAFGASGLGQMSQVPEDKRAELLVLKATEEAKDVSGAFFGALLAVRTGADLRAHARVLLDKLGQRKVDGGSTLKDALGFIAAMHAEELSFLSRPVLARALNIDLKKLHREVLVPLGQEAAATATSSFIFTRHRTIATTLISIFETEFGEDTTTLYEQLAVAAIDALKEGEYLPENPSCWRFDLPQHFRIKGNHETAVRIAEAVLSREPENRLTRTGVANLYRQLDNYPLAIKTFRGDPGTTGADGRYFFEWAVTEGESKNYELNALLAAFAISDAAHPFTHPKIHDVQIVMAGLGVAFQNLYESYSDSRFLRGRMAAAVLGLSVDTTDARTVDYLRVHFEAAQALGALPMPVSDALVCLKQAAEAAAEFRPPDREIVQRVGTVDSLTFEKLRRLVHRV